MRAEGVFIMRFALAGVLLAAVAIFAVGQEQEAVSVSENPEMIIRQLPIPPRLQWRDRAGYCGECAIQQSAMYFGNYVSQFVCRDIIDTDQEQDVLVRVNADLVLEALRLEYEEFDTSEVPTPQYKEYLTWTKQHLHDGHPVIITMFDQDDNCWDYDHIVLATGFKSTDPTTYLPNDTLVFNDLFKLEPQIRPFESLHDTREMKGNGARHYFCIPTEYNFGCAVTGVEDESDELLPIRLTANVAEEPDVVKDQAPVTVTLEVTIRDLNPGSSYVLYRYDNHKHLPTREYHNSKYLSARKFVAESSTYKLTDQCHSNGAAFYRCVPVDTTETVSK